jgi:hypothetical protein
VTGVWPATKTAACGPEGSVGWKVQEANMAKMENPDPDDPDDLYEGTFEWWRHVASGVVLAIRLDRQSQVTGAVRPVRAPELEGPPTGFEWEEAHEYAPNLLGFVQSRRQEFKAIGNGVVKPLAGQRPDRSDVEALEAR